MKKQIQYTLFNFLLGALTVIAFIGLAGCDLTSKENTALWPLVEDCDLHTQACESQVGNAKVTLKISPHPIPIAKPLGIELTLENIQAKKVELDISGVNMYMGFNRVTLLPITEGKFVGTSMLAFCTNQKMAWQITLIVHLANGKQVQIPYALETINRKS